MPAGCVSDRHTLLTWRADIPQEIWKCSHFVLRVSAASFRKRSHRTVAQSLRLWFESGLGCPNRESRIEYAIFEDRVLVQRQTSPHSARFKPGGRAQ